MLLRAAMLLVAFVCATAIAAEPSQTGQTGLVHMPDARVAPEGVLRFGVSQTDPYLSIWSSISLFPRIELSARYVSIDRVPGFADAPELGDYRDKAFDAKLIALAESAYFPAVALGAQDYVGTQLFSSEYLALSKRFGDFDLTIGYGRDRIDGAFGGIRYTPRNRPGWRFLLEYDANHYANDFRADLSGAVRRTGGVTYGIGYRSGWWGAQLSYQDGAFGGNLYLAIPLMEREFVPKIHEPAPYSAVTPRATIAEWRAQPRYARILIQSLAQQGFKDVRVRLSEDTLDVSLTHARISLTSRIVGRAARTALHLGPSDMAALRIAYTENDQPLLVYAFNDLTLLQRYFDGRVGDTELEVGTTITFASAALAQQLREIMVLRLRDNSEGGTALLPAVTDHAFVGPPPRPASAGFRLFPLNVRLFFNDPGEPVRYETFSALAYRHRLDTGLHLDGTVRLTLFENVSDIRQPSTSLLPHVRSDIGEYRRRGDRLRLNALLLNKYALLRERVYGRASVGYYEEMYAGAGGQVLYLPWRGDWAVDLSIDALRQRAPGEALGFRDYSVVTAVASAHYRFPRSGVTATARVGRFLAKDEGVRVEFKRRFRSGVEIGAWYSWTNERDITNPGSPDNPYRDKGIFASVPLNGMLTRDTRERASLALADYTRDVGQLVMSPGDLYRLVERPLMLDSAEHGWLTEFDE